VPGAPAMVTNDDAHPHVAMAAAKQSSFRFCRFSTTNLTDFAEGRIETDHMRGAWRGKAVFSREARCWADRGSTYDLHQAQRPRQIFFSSRRQGITIIWQWTIRCGRIYLDVPHSANVKPSWYGEIRRHYERRHAVVDTIGQNTKTYVRHYRTPHSEKAACDRALYLTNEGKTIQAGHHGRGSGDLQTSHQGDPDLAGA